MLIIGLLLPTLCESIHNLFHHIWRTLIGQRTEGILHYRSPNYAFIHSWMVTSIFHPILRTTIFSNIFSIHHINVLSCNSADNLGSIMCVSMKRTVTTIRWLLLILIIVLRKRYLLKIKTLPCFSALQNSLLFSLSSFPEFLKPIKSSILHTFLKIGINWNHRQTFPWKNDYWSLLMLSPWIQSSLDL